MHVKFCYNLLFFIFKSSLNSPQITKVENWCPLTKNWEHLEYKKVPLVSLKGIIYSIEHGIKS